MGILRPQIELTRWIGIKEHVLKGSILQTTAETPKKFSLLCFCFQQITGNNTLWFMENTLPSNFRTFTVCWQKNWTSPIQCTRVNEMNVISICWPPCRDYRRRVCTTSIHYRANYLSIENSSSRPHKEWIQKWNLGKAGDITPSKLIDARTSTHLHVEDVTCE